MKIANIIFIFLLSASVISFAQNRPTSATDTSRADSLCEKCSVLNDLGRFDEAISTGTEACRFYAEADNSPRYPYALVELASAYLAIGRYGEAEQRLKNALDLSKKYGDQAEIAKILVLLSDTYLNSGRTSDASAVLLKAYPLATAVKNPELLATTHLAAARIHSADERFSEALSDCETGIAALLDTKHSKIAGQLKVHEASALLQSGRTKEADSRFRSALGIISGLTNSHDKAYGLISIGRGFRRLAQLIAQSRDDYIWLSATALGEALEVSEEIGDLRSISYSAGYLGQLYEDSGKMDEALGFTRRAVFAAQQVPAPECLFLWEWQLGRIFRAKGDFTSAISSYNSSIASLQSIRNEINGTCGTVPFLGSISKVVMEFADLLLKRADSESSGDGSSVFLLQAREAIESFKAFELQDYFQDACVTRLYSGKTKPEAIGKDTALLYSIVFPDRIELLVSTRSVIKRRSIGVNREQLSDEVKRFRYSLENPRDQEFKLHATKLYDWLIRPLLPDFEAWGIKTVVFVPDGPLRTIPIAALSDGTHYFIEGYEVVTSPGLNVTEVEKSYRRKMQVLCAGLTESVRGLEALKSARTELNAIHDLYPGHLYVDREFVTGTVRRDLGANPCSVVHIATHAQFGKRLSETFLVTWDGTMNMDDLDSMIRQNRLRKTPVELLTLSACNTAVGDDRAALGLAGMAVKSGAKSALATLWSVNDEATSALMIEFYRQLLNPSLSKAGALREAQLSLIRDKHYSHPFYWSPFLLIGNWM